MKTIKLLGLLGLLTIVLAVPSQAGVMILPADSIINGNKPAGQWWNLENVFVDDSTFAIDTVLSNKSDTFTVGFANPSGADTLKRKISSVVLYVKNRVHYTKGGQVWVFPRFGDELGYRQTGPLRVGYAMTTNSFDITPQDSIQAAFPDTTWHWSNINTLAMKYQPRTSGVIYYTDFAFVLVTYQDTSSITGPYHFTFSAIASPETLGLAFPVTITCRDTDNNVVTGYNGTASLSDVTGTVMPLAIAFTNGVCALSATIQDVINGDYLVVNDGVRSDTSNSFNVIDGGLYRFNISPVASPQKAGQAFPLDIQAIGFFGDTVAFTGQAALSDLSGKLTPATTGLFSGGLWSGSVSVSDTGGFTDVITASYGDRPVTGESNPFTVSETDSPFIFTNAPANGELDVALNAGVSITFSEPIKQSSFGYTFLPNPGGVSVGWNADSTVATFAHDDLASQTYYTVKVTNARDTAGNALAGCDSLRFRTLDANNPYIYDNAPANGAHGVALDAAVSVTFSEAIDRGSFTYEFTPDPGGVDTAWSADSTVVSFTHNDFSEITGYLVHITNAQDPSGNPLTGRDTVCFFTGEFTGPTITGTVPLDGATEVALDASTSITFSEPINHGTFAYTVSPDPGGVDTSWFGNTVTFAHGNYADQTAYTVTVTNCTDTAGNALTGPNSFGFTTRDGTGPAITVQALPTTPVTVYNFPFYADITDANGISMDSLWYGVKGGKGAQDSVVVHDSIDSGNPDRYWFHMGLTAGQWYYLYVVAFDNTIYQNRAQSTLDSITTDAILAVVLTGLNARQAAGGKEVTINWTTASEQNSHQWLIERSRMSENGYSPIGSMPAAGSCSEGRSYSFTDKEQLNPGQEYWYRLAEIDLNGTRSYFGPVKVTISKPGAYALNQAKPNPFTQSTMINYQLPMSGAVSIKIYNLAGQLVRTLVDARQDADYYSVRWNGTDEQGRRLANGVYLYRLAINDFTSMMKMIIIR